MEDLTLKQRKWLKVYLDTGNATEAAMQSYDIDPKDPEARNKAGVIGYENIRKLNYEDFLEQAGITDKLLQQKIMEGLEATKVISARVIVSKDKPTSQANGELPPATSQTDDFIDVPDFMARHKYLETALKLKQRLVDKPQMLQQINVNEGNTIVFTNFKDETKS